MFTGSGFHKFESSVIEKHVEYQSILTSNMMSLPNSVRIGSTWLRCGGQTSQEINLGRTQVDGISFYEFHRNMVLFNVCATVREGQQQKLHDIVSLVVIGE